MAKRGETTLTSKHKDFEVTIEGNFKTTCKVNSPRHKEQIEKIVSQAFLEQMLNMEIEVLVSHVDVVEAKTKH